MPWHEWCVVSLCVCVLLCDNARAAGTIEPFLVHFPAYRKQDVLDIVGQAVLRFTAIFF